jgi:putative transcriptional regulator
VSRKRIISVEHKPGDPHLPSDTDWEYVNSLTDEQIAAAVADDPDAAPINFFEKSGVTPIVNVFELRRRLNMTQEAFATAYGIPLGTLRDWEQRRKLPDATARTYLKLIERDPQAIANLLNPAA